MTVSARAVPNYSSSGDDPGRHAPRVARARLSRAVAVEFLRHRVPVGRQGGDEGHIAREQGVYVCPPSAVRARRARRARSAGERVAEVAHAGEG